MRPTVEIDGSDEVIGLYCLGFLARLRYHPAMSGDSESWEVRVVQRQVLVTFRRRVTEEAGRRAAEALVRVLGETREFEIVFDVREVETYDGRARQVWQDLLFPRRRQLRRLTVVSRSRVTRMGASVFAMVMGLECTTLTELPLGLR